MRERERTNRIRKFNRRYLVSIGERRIVKCECYTFLDSGGDSGKLAHCHTKSGNESGDFDYDTIL